MLSKPTANPVIIRIKIINIRTRSVSLVVPSMSYISGAPSYSENSNKEAVITRKENICYSWCFWIGRPASTLHNLLSTPSPVPSCRSLYRQEGNPRFQISSSPSSRYRGWFDETRMYVWGARLNPEEHRKGLCQKIHFRGGQKQLER